MLIKSSLRHFFPYFNQSINTSNLWLCSLNQFRQVSLRSMQCVSKKDVDTSTVDEIQAKLLQEMIIVVDQDDHQVGADTKKNCHIMENIEQGLLHRAFSVFLFNSKNELLIQRRALTKITFPDHYTNTCCSHPLNTNEETDCLDNIGVKRAAVRRLGQELGINQIEVEDFTFLTRIHYKAISGDSIWGEHEIDYILFAKKDVNVCPNPNEVSDLCYMTESQLKDFLNDAKEKNVKITPWFRLISNTFLFAWWKNLNNLSKFQEINTIHRLL